MLVETGAEVGAVGVVEHGEGEPRLEDAVGDLAGMEGEVEGERALLVWPVAPLRPPPLLLEPPRRGQGLGPDDQGEVEVAD